MAPKTRGERIEVPEESVQAMRTDVKALCDREAGNTKRIDDLDKGIQAIMGKLDSLFKAGSDNSTQTEVRFKVLVREEVQNRNLKGVLIPRYSSTQIREEPANLQLRDFLRRIGDCDGLNYPCSMESIQMDGFLGRNVILPFSVLSRRRSPLQGFVWKARL